MPDFFDVLNTRRTVRSYTSEPVSRRQLQELVDSAILAPTGMNLQPWAFSAVTSREVLGRVNEIVVRLLCGPEFQKRASPRLKEIVSAPDFHIFHGAPALIAISGDCKVPGAAFDCQLAAENLFLAAHAKGLGTCYMGLLLLAAEEPEAQKLLGIPEGFKMMAAAVVGHPAARPDGPPERSPARIAWIG